MIALAQGYEAACIPVWQGCTSISRAARYGDAIFWFRGLMLPMASLLAIYWILHCRWLNDVVGRHYRHGIILLLGFTSALALAIYANFLGTDGDIYRFMRRFGVTFYFAFSMLAQLISIYSLYAIGHRLLPRVNRLVRWQFFLVSLQWLIGLGSLVIISLQPEFKDQANNIVEWNFALMMTLFYAVSAMLWSMPNSTLSGSAQ